MEYSFLGKKIIISSENKRKWGAVQLTNKSLAFPLDDIVDTFGGMVLVGFDQSLVSS